MLKIITIDSRTQRRVVIEGKLIELWAAELRNTCAMAKSDLHGRELVLELKQITAISQEGENLLLALMNDGVKIRCSGVFTKQIVRQLARRKVAELAQPTI